VKKILVALCATATLLMAGMEEDKIDYSALDKIATKDLSHLMAEEMTNNLHLPVQIDYLTTLVSIVSYGNKILLTKEVDTKHKDLQKLLATKKDRQRFKKIMFGIDARTLCHNETWNYLIVKRNIIPALHYLDKSSRELFSYTVDAKDCATIDKN